MDVFNALVPRKLSSNVVVLVATGSLNPVHLMHVKMLEVAAAELTKQGKLVCAAWLSPSDANWSCNKPHGCFANEAKLKLAKLAVKGHPLIRISSWEILLGKPVDFGSVIHHISSVVPAMVSKC